MGSVAVFSRSLGLLESLSWREAQDVCEGLGGYLAEIRSEEQQTFLVGLLALLQYKVPAIIISLQESIAMLEEEFTGSRSWFIGLTDFGHEGR